MRVLILTRYPKVDTPSWKRDLAGRLAGAGAELSVLYTRSSLPDQAKAGWADLGPRRVAEYARARLAGGGEAGTGEPSQSLAAWAEERGLPVFRHARLSDESTLDRIRSIAPDVALLAGADIVPQAVIDLPRLGTLNGHYGLLPKYRGMNVTEWSIYHDDPVGVSVHFVDRGIDTGAIVAREEITVERGDALADLRPKHQRTAARLLAESCLKLGEGAIDATPQQASEGRQYYRMHPLLRERVEARLASGAYRWIS